jgi:hypothetical protein
MIITLVLAAALQAPAAPPSAAPSPAPPPVKAAAPRQEPSVPTPSKGIRKRLKATLIAIDAEAMTISFRDEEGRSQTWPVDRKLAAASPLRAEQAFKALSPGDTVWILYSDDDGPATIMDMRRVKPRPAQGDRPED